MVAHLDITLASLVNRELKAMSERMKEKYWEEKEQYWNMLGTKESKNEEDDEEELDDDDEEEVEEEKNLEDKVKKDDTEKEKVGKEKDGTLKVTSTDDADNNKLESSCEINTHSSEKTEEKDWQQMLRLVMLLQKEGNFHIKEKHFEEASVKLKEAIEYVDILLNKVSVKV